MAGVTVRAAGFIVTFFGDVVVPRGGEIATGNIITACAALGISETLVRTALSRLVAAGQLESHRLGRRSFYRLAPAAGPEFDAAARSIYQGEAPGGWRLVFLPEGEAEALMPQLERQGYARLRPQLAIGPDHLPAPETGLSLAATPEQGLVHLPAFAASAWDLSEHAQAYAAFIARFSPFTTAPLAPAEALTARLLLVHAYRQVLLRDPRLPSAALPADWPGLTARRVFARAYLNLSAGADAHVAASCEALAGALSAMSATTEARLTSLRQQREGPTPPA